MKTGLNDTIVALATPFGISALALIRLTGPESIQITDKIFTSSKDENLNDVKSHTVRYGYISDDTKMIDEVMVSVFKSPNTYTGENIVEISCHGGGVIISSILELFTDKGARPAEPGEFTKRAFLNGKMDLTQAESVNNVINAGSRRALDGALKVLKGSLREKTEEIKNALYEVKSNIDADIEWGDTEELETIERSELINILQSAAKTTEEIINSSKSYSGIYSGFRVVIAGRPNSGKSSLFNELLQESRSIVNNIPGTTRDVIESEVVTDSYLIRYVDTAGLGLDNPGEIDRLSAAKSRDEIDSAELLLLVVDNEKGAGKIEKDIGDLAADKRKLIVLNKTDREGVLNKEDLKEFAPEEDIIETSAITGRGLKDLKEAIKRYIDSAQPDDIMVSARQKNAFKDTFNTIEKVIDILNMRPVSYEVASYEISEAINCLGLVDGSLIKEDILDRIFSNFCVGK